jgi:hypothetical protein
MLSPTTARDMAGLFRPTPRGVVHALLTRRRVARRLAREERPEG